MSVLDSIDMDTILSGNGHWIESELAEELSEHPLNCIGTEFPHWVGSIDSMDGLERPSEQHPVFYGCFDWHSAVHSHWCLIRQLRLISDHPLESKILSRIGAKYSEAHVEQEVSFFESHEKFERPYGWGWFLRLVAELVLWDDERGNEWRAILEPLEIKILDLIKTHFLTQSQPLRVGTHGNSAFALQCILDYARVTSNDSLESEIVETTRAFYLEDRNYPIQIEPLSWDFFSPALVEADLLRRIMDQHEFGEWLDEFLQIEHKPAFESFLEPHHVDLESAGGAELHLIGLNLSKSWCMAGIVSGLENRRVVELLKQSAKRHAEFGLKQAFTEKYEGSHWLSSFALYLLTRNDGGIAPKG